MAVLTLLYGSECWAPRKRDLRQKESSEMKFLRSMKGCVIGDRIQNTTIRGTKHSVGCTTGIHV